jgi:hypothetical protein
MNRVKPLSGAPVKPQCRYFCALRSGFECTLLNPVAWPELLLSIESAGLLRDVQNASTYERSRGPSALADVQPEPHMLSFASHLITPESGECPEVK